MTDAACGWTACSVRDNIFQQTLIMGVISNGLMILGLESSIQMIVKGIIIIAAVRMSEKSR